MSSSNENDPKPHPDPSEPVWTYRGYELKAGEFNTAMVHLFRAEVARANVWRQRLDTTTNWAVITTGAVISLAFAQQVSHLVILLNLLLVTIFLVIEARRYRYFELWSSRIRMMETDFFAAMLVPPFKPSADWAEGMAETLLHPEFPISEMDALGRRLRRNYLWIYLVLGIAWLGRLSLSPVAAHSFAEIVQNAAFENISGAGMFTMVGVFYLILLSLALLTVGLRRASGEVLSNPNVMGFDFEDADDGEPAKEHERAWFRRSRRRQEIVALIITDDSQKIAERILLDMRRGATILKGEGAYTHMEHSVLMVAITSTEIPVLKKLVAAESPNAFVMIVPAKNILGGGFAPLKEK
jgi:uncharacterized membrane protein